MRADAMILVFWMLSFKPAFSLSSFTRIKRFFSYFSISTIRVVSSAYLLHIICISVAYHLHIISCRYSPSNLDSSLWFTQPGTSPGKPGVLQSMGSQRVRHDWATELTDSAYMLNKQSDNIQPYYTPFPIWNQSGVPSLVLLLLDSHTGFSGDR